MPSIRVRDEAIDLTEAIPIGTSARSSHAVGAGQQSAIP